MAKLLAKSPVSDEVYELTNIEVIQQGGGEVATPKDVNFYDYDGTLLHSYTAEEFLELSTMPANPTHEGLTAQGWNWTLSDAQDYVSDYGACDIGQMYVTDDGTTRIYIKLEEGRLSPYLGFAVNGTVDVDWGDGTEHSTVTGTSTSTVLYTQHKYASAGEYKIVLSSESTIWFIGIQSYGSQLLTKHANNNQDKVYQNAIQKIELGNVNIVNYAFSGCTGLTSITVPDSVTSIVNYAFNGCSGLTSITIPNSVISIGGSAFTSCRGLTSITIPSSVTSISDYAFYNCTGLTSITIPNSVTSIGQRAFHNCTGLRSIITIPNSVTSIGYSAFYNCSGLTSINIPSSVTSISDYAFYNCTGLGFVKFLPTRPPTVSNSDAWTNVPTDCQLRVPYDSPDYLHGGNYPDSETYAYIGFGTFESGGTLPAQTTDTQYDLTWYATADDAVAHTNPITEGNGNEVYCSFRRAP